MAEERLTEIREARLKKRDALLEGGNDPYPAEARRTHTTAELLANFAEEENNNTPIMLAGRIVALRQHGGVVFMDLADAYGIIQLQLTKDQVAKEEFDKVGLLDVGDFVQAAGQAITTQRGVETLLIKQWHILAKSIRPLPSKWYGLKEAEKRYRRRELDLLLSEEARRPIMIKGVVMDWLRQYLKQNGFVEVETPVLQPQAGGAAAEPFVTHHNALGTDLYLRIAPELYLKKLLVGGLEKVFEIGKNFRNEGIDREHNPEFSMCEFYWAYADYEDLMDFTEQMIAQLVKDIVGGEELDYLEERLVFSAPWQRIKFTNLMKEKLGVDILEEKNPAVYEKLLMEHNLEVPEVKTYNKLVDELYKKILRPTLVQPTLLYDYPTELVPLAKTKAQDERVAEMMQVVVTGTELVKAYSELNDPIRQRAKFEEQQVAREMGDKEASLIDEDYLEAMEYGMPPAAGWGIGIDRLTAILSNAPSIRDTITFPLLKPNKK